MGTEDKSRRLIFEVTLHGFLLWASMGFLMPVGILAIRMSNRAQCGRRLKIMFYIHANFLLSLLQILSVILSTAAAIMSIKNFENSFNNYHQRMGLVLYAVIWLQALSGFLRPQRGSTRRSAWFFVHWVLGTAVSLLGIIHIYTGLQAYQRKTSKSVKLWIMLFTAEISFIALFYLFQDKWDYIQKQGVMLGNETIQPTHQEIYPRDKQKEVFTGRPS
ncbi:hypothetical protein RJ639_044453 [Escallonia herrerae]|uniref:Cytochrome b561 domain-containing protein n=1 Tax=Escallonia herrerae TaxID=1293975 RepID=A0AA89B047_9ASTE|nr:hypothetical protein RJ639_044453 [Escallonia herrerae]